MFALLNFPLMRLSAATRPTKSSMTAVMAGFAPSLSYNEVGGIRLLVLPSSKPAVDDFRSPAQPIITMAQLKTTDEAKQDVFIVASLKIGRPRVRLWLRP